MKTNITNPLIKMSHAELRVMMASSDRFEAFAAQDELDNRGVTPNVIRVRNPYRKWSTAELRRGERFAFNQDSVSYHAALTIEADRFADTVRRCAMGCGVFWTWLYKRLGLAA